MTSTIRLAKHALDHGSIAVLAFNRPAAKNAMSRAMLAELDDYVSGLATGADPDVRALVLSSTLRDVFCAGADLKERKTFTPQETKQFLVKWNGTLERLQNLAIPTISALQGLALGGGLETALATDFRVLGTTAAVGLPETRLAILPGAGGTVRLPKLIGYSRALDMVLTGRRVSPAEALTFGLANRVAEDAEEAAVEFAREICAGGPLAINLAKQAVKGGTDDWRLATYEGVVNTEDKFEALRAFAEKRKPNFKGK